MMSHLVEVARLLSVLLMLWLAAFVVSCEQQDGRRTAVTPPGPSEQTPDEELTPAEKKKAREGASPEEKRKGIAPLPPIELKPEEEDRIGLLADALLDFLESKFANDTLFFSRYREEFERKVRDSRQFIALLQEFYAARNYSPLFFEFDQRIPNLTAEGSRLRDLMLAMPTHGLAAQDYRLELLNEALKKLEPLRQDYLTARQGLAGERSRKLWELVEGLTAIPDESRLKATLLEAGFTNEDAALVKELARFYPNLLQTKRELNGAVLDIDIVLLRGFFQFLLDFKYVLKAHPFKATPEQSLAHVKFREKLRDDFQKATPELAGYLERLIPPNPNYARLQKALSHYQRLAAEGEADKIKFKRNLAEGTRSPAVKELARRLALEGYLAPERVSDRFDGTMVHAVKLYQRKHQLQVNGKVDTSTRTSMGVSMARRAKQIELGLQRWRESAITRDNPAFFFRVNIPQFELEVWENNQRIRVHRTVVGNRTEETSIERKQRGRFNLTPLLESQLTTVVLNPLWFPPPRLQKELLADMVREPDFFEKNNYGIRMSEDGKEVIFQKAGPDNALGQVKFLFPNEYDVYLHDTPKKALFERPVRAYSHGCMRLDKPLEMAEFLLGRFNDMDRRDIDKILERGKEHYIKLQTTVPVYVEYNVVGTDDEGWVHFFADIYDYDKAYWENRLPVVNAEDLTSSEVKRLTKAGDQEGSTALDGLDGFDDGP